MSGDNNVSNNSNSNSSSNNNPITGSGSGGTDGDDALTSFTNFGTDGLDTDTLNLFGSFTNDSAQGNSLEGLGGFGMSGNTNDLSGFGVDLGALEMGNTGVDNVSGGMDLSEINLLQLDEQLTSEKTSSTNDAAQMMARLLAGGALTRTTKEGDIEENITSSAAAATLIAPVSSTSVTGSAPPASVVNMDVQMNLSTPLDPANIVSMDTSTASRQERFEKKSRTSSQSSGDMGDIPLAQLALIQPHGSASSGSQSQVLSGPEAPGQSSGVGITLQPEPTISQVPLPAANAIKSTVLPVSVHHSMASTGIDMGVGTGVLPVNMTQLGVSANPKTSMVYTPMSESGSGPVGALQTIAQSTINSSISGAVNDQLGASLTAPAPTTAAAISISPNFASSSMNGSSAAEFANNSECHESVKIENGTTGVKSTVFLGEADPSAPLNPLLNLERNELTESITRAPLDELEEIENKLCHLLKIASRVIGILAEPKETSEFGDDALGSNTKIEPIVNEFMTTIAEVQAGIHFHHKKLLSYGIPMQTHASFHSDVAGPERDLLNWTEASQILSVALKRALEYSMSS